MKGYKYVNVHDIKVSIIMQNAQACTNESNKNYLRKNIMAQSG